MATALRYLSYRELISLIVCVFLDLIDYVVPMFLVPLFGDIIDVFGLIIALLFFGWLGLISLIEFVPYFDVLPMSTVNWLFWLLSRRSEEWLYGKDVEYEG